MAARHVSHRSIAQDWPGPRVRYGPYNVASREFFDALADALTATGGGAAIERGSIDEAYVELARTPRGRCRVCRRSGEKSRRVCWLRRGPVTCKIELFYASIRPRAVQ